jgi:hypothetical protein
MAINVDFSLGSSLTSNNLRTTIGDFLVQQPHVQFDSGSSRFWSPSDRTAMLTKRYFRPNLIIQEISDGTIINMVKLERFIAIVTDAMQGVRRSKITALWIRYRHPDLAKKYRFLYHQAATDYIVERLAKKQAEVAGKTENMHDDRRALAQELEHIEATLALVARDRKLGSIKPKVFRTPARWSNRGKMTRLVRGYCAKPAIG